MEGERWFVTESVNDGDKNYSNKVLGGFSFPYDHMIIMAYDMKPHAFENSPHYH